MSLSQIAKNHCSNHNNGDCCIADLPCRICNGLPCETFRTAVWKEIDPAYRYSRDHHVYKRNVAEFNRMFGVAKAAKVRLCGCGAVLAKRRRVCDSCAQKNRRAAYRVSKSKKVG